MKLGKGVQEGKRMCKGPVSLKVGIGVFGEKIPGRWVCNLRQEG